MNLEIYFFFTGNWSWRFCNFLICGNRFMLLRRNIRHNLFRPNLFLQRRSRRHRRNFRGVFGRPFCRNTILSDFLHSVLPGKLNFWFIFILNLEYGIFGCPLISGRRQWTLSFIKKTIIFLVIGPPVIQICLVVKILESVTDGIGFDALL